MERIGRRRLLGAGVASLALAGCLESLRGDDGGSDDSSLPGDLSSTLPESLQGAFDGVPSTIGEQSATALLIGDPDELARGTVIAAFLRPPDVGADRAAVDRVAMVSYGSFSSSVTVATGSFAAADLVEPEDGALVAEDGRALVASEEGSPWSEARDAIRATRRGETPSLAEEYRLGALLGPIATEPQITVELNPGPDSLASDAAFDASTVTGYAAGVRADLEARERRITFVLRFESGAAVDAEGFRATLSAASGPTPEDVSTRVDGRRLVVRGTTVLPQGIPDDSPNLWFDVWYDRETEEAILEANGEATVPAQRLELRVDGDVVDPPWSSGATIADGDEFRVVAAPLSIVGVHWLDPEYDATPAVGRDVVDASGQFSRSYDAEANELAITYEGERSWDPAAFVLQITRSRSGVESARPLAESVDSLEPDTTIVLEDVQFGGQVDVERRLPDRPASRPETVETFRIRPPGYFSIERTDEGYALRASSFESAPATDYRVEIDGEPAATQWADRGTTFADGDRLPLDAPAGARIVVQYVGDAEPVPVFEAETPPDADFDFEVREASVVITHAGGSALDAEELLVSLDGLPVPERPDAWASEYETVTEGDSITVPFAVDGEEVGRPYRVTVRHEYETLDSVDVDRS